MPDTSSSTPNTRRTPRNFSHYHKADWHHNQLLYQYYGINIPRPSMKKENHIDFDEKRALQKGASKGNQYNILRIIQQYSKYTTKQTTQISIIISTNHPGCWKTPGRRAPAQLRIILTTTDLYVSYVRDGMYLRIYEMSCQLSIPGLRNNNPATSLRPHHAPLCSLSIYQPVTISKLSTIIIWDDDRYRHQSYHR